MICWFEFDVWSQANFTRMNRRLQLERFGVARDRVAEPSEIGRFINPSRIVPQITGTLKICPAKRNPKAPSEDVSAIHNRNFDETTDEKMFIIHDALIG